MEIKGSSLLDVAVQIQVRYTEYNVVGLWQMLHKRKAQGNI